MGVLPLSGSELWKPCEVAAVPVTPHLGDAGVRVQLGQGARQGAIPEPCREPAAPWPPMGRGGFQMPPMRAGGRRGRPLLGPQHTGPRVVLDFLAAQTQAQCGRKQGCVTERAPLRAAPGKQVGAGLSWGRQGNADSQQGDPHPAF